MKHEWGSAPDFVGPRHDLRERLLLRLFLAGRPGHRVLNAGAGQGTFSQRLERLGFEVTSTDASPAAVRVLRDRVEGRTLEARLEALPFEDGCFDAAVLGEVLEHVEDDVGALREVVRVLRPGGLVALSVPRNPAWFGPSDRWAGHVRRYARDTLVQTVALAGLALERLEPWGFPVSALYHRLAYDRHVARHGATAPRAWQRPALALLAGALQLDRLFVGRERGALGYLALARASPPAALERDRGVRGRVRGALDAAPPGVQHGTVRPGQHGAGRLGDGARRPAAGDEPHG